MEKATSSQLNEVCKQVGISGSEMYDIMSLAYQRFRKEITSKRAGEKIVAVLMKVRRCRVADELDNGERFSYEVKYLTDYEEMFSRDFIYVLEAFEHNVSTKFALELCSVVEDMYKNNVSARNEVEESCNMYILLAIKEFKRKNKDA